MGGDLTQTMSSKFRIGERTQVQLFSRIIPIVNHTVNLLRLEAQSIRGLLFSLKTQKKEECILCNDLNLLTPLLVLAPQEPFFSPIGLQLSS